jgi:ribosomal protein S18 acetylase RimI-like enzyme
LISLRQPSREERDIAHTSNCVADSSADADQLLSGHSGHQNDVVVTASGDPLRKKLHKRGYFVGALANMTRRHLGGIVIRSATEADVAPIAEIHAASWRDAYAHILTREFLSGSIATDRLAVWSQRLRDSPPTQLVNVALDPTGHAQGFVCGYCDVDPAWGSLVDNLHVRPQARGRGIGEQLFRSLAGEFSAKAFSSGLHLWVFEANVAGLRFYERLGGRVVEKGRSKIPAAGGKAVLRVHWPTVAQIG